MALQAALDFTLDLASSTLGKLAVRPSTTNIPTWLANTLVAATCAACLVSETPQNWRRRQGLAAPHRSPPLGRERLSGLAARRLERLSGSCPGSAAQPGAGS